MSVGVLIISHDNIGEAILDTASNMIDNHPLKVKLLAANRKSDPDDLFETAKSLLDEVNDGDGVLVLTDLLGSTPSNVAHRLKEYKNVNIVTGINLSMLIRLFNYPDLDLSDITNKAYSGGVDGITVSLGNTE